MHQGMYESRAGQIVGYWRGGRAIYVPAGGSVDASPETPPQGAPAGPIRVTEPPAAPTPPQPITADELARQRAQWQAEADQRMAEREAEFQRMLEERMRPIEDERAARQREVEEAQAAAAEAERLRLEAEESAAQRAERIANEAQERTRQLEAQLVQRDEIVRREQERTELMQYRSEQLAAHAQDIHPAMHNLVGGFSREEIDASITRAQAATAQMIEEFAQEQQNNRNAIQEYQRQQPTASVTQPPSGPIESLGSERSFSNEELANMSPAEYERYRPQLLRAASAAYHGNR